MAFNPFNNQTDIVRFAFYLGAVTDALALIPMLVPKTGALVLGVEPGGPSPFEVSFQGTAVALMAGWTVLLVWGAQAPIERRHILLFTVVPVIIGIALSLVLAIQAGIYPFDKIKFLFIHQAFVSGMCIWGFVIASGKARELAMA